MNTIEKTGERIRFMRKQKGLTQEELAHLINRSSNQVARWERGEVKLKTETITDIARVLNTSSSYLLGETDNPDELAQQVIELADSSWGDNMPNQISAGFNGTHYEIYDGNTNQTIRIPNDTEGRKIFLEFMNRTLNFHQPIVSNTITGDNNTNNKLGVVNN